MIRIETADKEEIKIDTSEVFRYLGYGKNEPDESIYNLTAECIEEVREKLSPKACYDKFDIVRCDDNSIGFATIKTNSKALIKNLKDCDEVIIFVATIGADIDRLIQKYSIINPSKAVVLQSIGAVFVEAWCDIICQRIRNMYNKYQRPRFSPGYGDFELTKQSEIFELLDCHRKIGVILAESLLMIPTKSVSAVIGLSDKNLKCEMSGCEICKNLQCEYRRN